jgi:hypothetical protein
VDELYELLDNRTEQANEDERFTILDTIKAVFGDDVEVIEFEPYDNEGTTKTRRGN